ncbi:hypothetical protein H6G96_31560 [Nostoc sp. FACHB-892]|uniref:hypothetical protein n=1 Tax=Nostoc sp. FACHB-892 TaxID=2692843 RepID=UPI0016859E49|nr:hypothetical protein [Nostoc sp. FACHB-892]MBD2730734.1 hypothetical protein [Nostoc sp. FACHB-892]
MSKNLWEKNLLVLQKLSVVSVGAMAIFLATLGKPASATSFVGTPSPNLNISFGTLINFDDKPAGVINSNDYVSSGVTSITGSETLQRYAFTFQSQPSYVGTSSFDGSIRFEFAQLVNQVGIGIASGDATAEVLKVFDASFNLLESFTVPNVNVSNIYAGITRNAGDIKYLEVSGSFFAVDDLQFSNSSVQSVPEASSILGLVAIGGLAVGRIKRRQISVATTR